MFVVTAPSSSPHRVFFERILTVYLVTVYKFIFKGVVSLGNRSFCPQVISPRLLSLLFSSHLARFIKQQTTLSIGLPA